jgi:tetratricopeptide (TPR) repeat protein
MFRWLVAVPLILAIAGWAQNSSSSSSSAPLPDAPQPTNPAPQSNTPTQTTPSQNTSNKNTPTPTPKPNFNPPSSDHVDAGALPEGESSSKDDDIDLSPPAGDAAAHPNSPSSFGAGAPLPGADINETHPFDPHKAAKDIEVGDFYFRRKNYRAAQSRYREALLYKDNDAVATYRLAVCLEKLDRPEEAREEYESYLKILPKGHDAEHARKALEQLKNAAAKSTTSK